MIESRTVSCSDEKPESSINRRRGVTENERENVAHGKGSERLDAFEYGVNREALQMQFRTVLDILENSVQDEVSLLYIYQLLKI
jgi:hypothetical protein